MDLKERIAENRFAIGQERAYQVNKMTLEEYRGYVAYSNQAEPDADGKYLAPLTLGLLRNWLLTKTPFRFEVAVATLQDLIRAGICAMLGHKMEWEDPGTEYPMPPVGHCTRCGQQD